MFKPQTYRDKLLFHVYCYYGVELEAKIDQSISLSKNLEQSNSFVQASASATTWLYGFEYVFNATSEEVSFRGPDGYSFKSL